MESMSFDSSMAVILAWNLSGRDLSTFSYDHGFKNSLPKIKGWVDYVLEFGIELIEWLILLHLDLLKACSKPLRLRIFNGLSSFIGRLENSSCFLCSFSRGCFLKLLICDHTKNDIQRSTVEVCHFDLCIIPISRRFLWLSLANLHSLPHFLI